MDNSHKTRIFAVCKSALGLWLGVCASLAPSVHAEQAQTDQHQLGTKYSPLPQINRSNVAELERRGSLISVICPHKGTPCRWWRLKISRV